MTKQKHPAETLLNIPEKSFLILSILVMVGTLPLTYLMFGIPLLCLPVAILAIFVIAGKIRSTTAVRTIQTLTILAGLSTAWLAAILYNYSTS